MEQNKSIRLTQSAIMLAFATILSAIPIVTLPYGGSITAFSMLPIILISYRYGTGWGLFTAFDYSLLQMLFGMKNFMGTSVKAAAAIILLDYILAFTVLGLAGIFRKVMKDQVSALSVGAFFVCVLRYICHVISGCTVWEGVSIPSSDGFIYSLIYNATYMVPETLVTVIGAVYISRLLDFRSETITRTAPRAKVPDLAVLYAGLSKAFLAAFVVYDVVSVFGVIQSEEGEFDITNITSVNWSLFLLITVFGILLAVVFGVLASKVPQDSSADLSGLFSALPVAGVAAAATADVIYTVYTIAANSPVAAEGWVKIVLFTLAVIAAAYFVLKRYQSKKAAA